MNLISKIKNKINQLNFEKNTQNSGIYLDINHDYKDTLIITFGGMGHQALGDLPFEFLNTLSEFNVNKIYLRDTNQLWYLKGTKSLGNDVNSIVKLLNKEIYEKNKFSKVITVGGSSGGYAAILFGLLLNVDSVLALSPQTFLNSKEIDLLSDEYISTRMKKIKLLDNDNTIKKYLDLFNIIEEKKENKTKLFLLYSHNYEPDRIQANHLKDLNNVQLIPLCHDKHALGKEIKKRNLLKPLILNLIEGNDIWNFFENSEPNFLLSNNNDS